MHSNGNADIGLEIKVWYFHLLTTKCAEYAKFNLYIYFQIFVLCNVCLIHDWAHHTLCHFQFLSFGSEKESQWKRKIVWN